MSYLEGLPRPWRASTRPGRGYAPARRAAERGLEVAVCAPGSVARRPHERVKTDARDARRLARLLAAGGLTLVGVPRLEDEQLREVRAREDLRGDLMRARHRIGKLLMRRELRYPGPGGAWTLAHLDWLGGLGLGDRASELTLADYLHAHEVLVARRGGLDRAPGESAERSRFGPVIGRLRCLRGVETLTAPGLCVEAGGLERFAHPDRPASYFGLVPSEDTSGERRRQGAVTKAGSGHARRPLVEAARHYRRPPRVSSTLARRQIGRPAWAVDCAWRAQRRLYRRRQALHGARGLRGGVVAVAVARELSHFCWEPAVGC